MHGGCPVRDLPEPRAQRDASGSPRLPVQMHAVRGKSNPSAHVHSTPQSPSLPLQSEGGQSGAGLLPTGKARR